MRGPRIVTSRPPPRSARGAAITGCGPPPAADEQTVGGGGVPHGSRLLLVTALAVSAAILAIATMTAMTATGRPASGCGAPEGVPSAHAERAIPAELLELFQTAEREYGVPWNVLAAINKLETDFGRNLRPSSMGAVGWMQLMPPTWARHGLDADGDGRADPNSPADAIFSAAAYLRASGAPTDLR